MAGSAVYGTTPRAPVTWMCSRYKYRDRRETADPCTREQFSAGRGVHIAHGHEHTSVPLLVMVIVILSPAIAAAPLEQGSTPTSVTPNPCNRFIGTVYPLSCKLHDTAPLAAGSLARIELRRALWHDA